MIKLELYKEFDKDANMEQYLLIADLEDKRYMWAAYAGHDLFTWFNRCLKDLEKAIELYRQNASRKPTNGSGCVF